VLGWTVSYVVVGKILSPSDAKRTQFFIVKHGVASRDEGRETGLGEFDAPQVANGSIRGFETTPSRLPS
jgi:hypothetical protein